MADGELDGSAEVWGDGAGVMPGIGGIVAAALGVGFGVGIAMPGIGAIVGSGSAGDVAAITSATTTAKRLGSKRFLSASGRVYYRL